MTTKRYPPLNLHTLAVAIMTYHEPKDAKEANEFLDAFETLTEGTKYDIKHFSYLMMRDLGDLDGAPFIVFDPDEVERLGTEIHEWFESDEMYDLLGTWVLNQLGDDYFEEPMMP